MPKLATRESCTGCTACASVCPKGCIAMTADENGFLFPKVDEARCVSCGLCELVCPVMHLLKKTEKKPEAYAAYTKDEDARMASSSGGLFTEIAGVVLEDGGVVFGAAYDDRFRVVHRCAETREDLAALRGAKYAQSDLTDIFPQIRRYLDNGRKVLFFGTPCQVAGLQAFLRKPCSNLLTIDCVCHSVPSPMAWQEYVQYRAGQDNGGELPVSVNLRSKQSGWSNYRYSNVFFYQNGRSHSVISADSLYMKLFGGGYLSRTSCAACRFRGYHRCSDLTLGDFWGIWNIAPELDDNKGTSVVLVQSEKGAELIRRLNSRLVIKPVTLEEASKENPAMLRSSAQPAKREEALAKIRAGEIGGCAAWFVPKHLTMGQKIRRLGGKILRRIKWKY